MKNNMNPKVDAYLKNAKAWREEFEKLRTIVLDCELSEDIKWRNPCYMFEGGNVVIIHGFKEYCALLFIKGSLLKDPNGILVQQTQNVQAARQIRFKSVQEIVAMEAIIKTYILEAIEVEKSGVEVEFKNETQYDIPEEFQERLNNVPALKTAFESLTPGRQKAYLLHFSAPKQAKTRESRIDKCVDRILDGIGLND